MSFRWIWALAVTVAAAGAVLDWRFRRIPNWLTGAGAVAGLALNAVLFGWAGAMQSLVGLLVGLGLLLPLVLLRSLGAGDWKLAGAIGAICGVSNLIAILVITIFVAGVMALAAIVYEHRVGEALANTREILRSLLWLRTPPSLTTDSPGALKIPFGVAMGIAVVLYAVRQSGGAFWV